MTLHREASPAGVPTLHGADPDGRRAEGSRRFIELRRLAVLARSSLERGRRPWLGVALGATSVAVYLLLPNPIIGRTLWHLGAVFASLPLTTELWRLPMSLFLPTPYLPVWGAALQLVVVIGLSELVLGRWLTIAVATFGHVAATLTARVMIDFVHGGLLGLSPELAHVLDTGPSAAATAVGAYLLLVLGMRRCASLLCVGLLIAALVTPGVDGLEHLVALACGLLAGRFLPMHYRWHRPHELGASGSFGPILITTPHPSERAQG